MQINCRLFQQDGEYRRTMISTEPLYRPRRSAAAMREMRSMDLEDWTEQQRRRREDMDFGMVVMRMLGTVNGVSAEQGCCIC